MALGHRRLAGLDLRRAGHAPLYPGGGAVCRAVARGRQHHRPARGPVWLDHPGRLHARLGAGRRVLRAHRRPAGPRAYAEPHCPNLRRLHRAVLLCADLVAPAHLPVSGCAGHRWGMGGGGVVALGNLAAPVAALDRGGAPDRRQRRHPRRRAGQCHPSRGSPALSVPGRRAAGLAGLLDPPRGARNGGVAVGQGAGSSP